MRYYEERIDELQQLIHELIAAGQAMRNLDCDCEGPDGHIYFEVHKAWDEVSASAKGAV